MTEVVSARDILPNLYENSGNNDEDYEVDENEDHEEDIVDDLTYDVYNLTACNYHPIAIQDDSTNEQREDLFLDLTARSTQFLVKRIFECTIDKTELGPLAVLPVESFILPREKRIPEPPAETRWEKYAREKGILNKKRDRMLFDEESQEWKPRFGYKRINNGIEDVPIIEVKEGQDPYADPWLEDRNSKKQRINKNLVNRERNILRASGKLGKKNKYDPTVNTGIPVDVDDSKKKRGKEGVRKALQFVQHSTQSLGRFDEMRPGEPVRKIKGKKRSFKDNIQSNDNDDMKKQLRIVADKVDKKERRVTNSLKSYEGLIPDAPTNAFKTKKGKNKATVEKKPRKKNRN